MSIVCNCNDDDNNIDNHKCDSITYGNQVVAVLFQKPAGADFDGSAGNNITLQADWQAKLNATGTDKVSVIPYTSSSELPEPDDTIAEDNDVAYGGQELDDRKQILTFAMRYLNANIFDQIDLITNCTNLRRVWLLDNKGWVWASASTGQGIVDASILMKSPVIGGIGTRTMITGNTVTWHSPCTHRPVTQATYLQGLIDDLVTSPSAS